MRGASFKNAQFGHANMSGVNAGALMFGGGSTTRRFSPCNFEGAKLRYVNLTNAQLKNAVFKGADLSYADLTGSDLRDIDFTDTIMKNTILENAQIEGADFPKSGNPIFKIPSD